MKACSAVFGIVVGLFAVASPVFNSGRCIAAEGAANRESISGRSAPTASWGHVNGEDADHPPEARLFDRLAEWEYESGDTRHLSCQDVCKEEPKLFRVFEMSANFDPPDRADETGVLDRKVHQILDAEGWNKCKSIEPGDGTNSDTYSKDQRLLELSRVC